MQRGTRQVSKADLACQMFRCRFETAEGVEVNRRLLSQHEGIADKLR